MSSIASQITGLQNATTITQNQTNTPAAKELDGDAFMTLMLEQLKNQDPLNPVDNQEFLAQQAQMTQVSELQELNENFSISTQISQASSLIGKEVSVLNPNDNTQVITGTVSAANFSGSDATIVIGGKDYPLGYVVSVTEPTSTSDSSSSTTESST